MEWAKDGLSGGLQSPALPPPDKRFQRERIPDSLLGDVVWLASDAESCVLSWLVTLDVADGVGDIEGMSVVDEFIDGPVRAPMGGGGEIGAARLSEVGGGDEGSGILCASGASSLFGGDPGTDSRADGKGGTASPGSEADDEAAE